MRKEALAFPPEESTLFFINSHLIITYDKQYFVILLSAKTQKGINIPPEAL